MENVSEIVGSYDRLLTARSANRITVHLAMSTTMARLFVPTISEAFPDIDLDVRTAKPRKLYDVARTKRARLSADSCNTELSCGNDARR